MFNSIYTFVTASTPGLSSKSGPDGCSSRSCCHGYTAEIYRVWWRFYIMIRRQRTASWWLSNFDYTKIRDLLWRKKWSHQNSWPQYGSKKSTPKVMDISIVGGWGQWLPTNFSFKYVMLNACNNNNVAIRLTKNIT